MELLIENWKVGLNHLVVDVASVLEVAVLEVGAVLVVVAELETAEIVEIDDSFIRNINTPDDFKAAQKEINE